MEDATWTQNAVTLGLIGLSMASFAWGNRYWRFQEQPAPTLLFIGVRSLIGTGWALLLWGIWTGGLPVFVPSVLYFHAILLGFLGFLGLYAFVKSLNSDHAASALVGQSLQVVVGFAVGSLLSGVEPTRNQWISAALLVSIQLILLVRKGGISGWIPASAGIAYGLYYPLSVPALRELGSLPFFLTAEWAQGCAALALGISKGEWSLFRRPLWLNATKQAGLSAVGQLSYFGALSIAALPQVVLISGLGFTVNYLALHRPKTPSDWKYLLYFLLAGLAGSVLTLTN